MTLRFNIDLTDNNLINLFASELKNVKQIMESENTNFYLNIRFSKEDFETMDLSKAATITISKDGFACYSLDTYSSSFIFFKDIVGLELVEVKE